MLWAVSLTAAFVVPTATFAGRKYATRRASALPLLLEPPTTLMLSKIDLAQVRADREAVEAVLDEIDRVTSAGLGLPIESPTAIATAAESAAASDSGLGLLEVSQWPPIPAVAIPVVMIFLATRSELRSNWKVDYHGLLGLLSLVREKGV